MVSIEAGANAQAEVHKLRRVWLVRHGLTAWNTKGRFCGWSDIPLARTGRMQARWLARMLRAKPLTTLYSSDLLRARETADIISAAYGPALTVAYSSAWRELNFGDWDGLTYAEITQQFPTQLDFFHTPIQSSPPHGESLVHLQQRVLSGLTQAIASSEGDLVIVSHGGPLRVLLCSMLGLSLDQQWRFELAPGSLSGLELFSGPDHALPQEGILTLLNLQRSSFPQRSQRLPPVKDTAL